MNFETWLKNRSNDYDEIFINGHIRGEIVKAWEMYGGDHKFLLALNKIFDREKIFFVEALREAGEAAVELSQGGICPHHSTYHSSFSDARRSVVHICNCEGKL